MNAIKGLFKLRPLGFVSFRWAGEFGPTIRGPIVWSKSEPVPLPTGIEGAMAMAAHVSGLVDNINESDKCDVGCLHNKILKQAICPDCQELTIRGPYVLVEAGKDEVICLHKWPSELYCIPSAETGSPFVVNVLKDAAVTSIGVGLTTHTKTAVKGLIYTQTHVDYQVLAKAIIKKALIRNDSPVAYIACDVRGIDGGIRTFRNAIITVGGEGRLAEATLETKDKTPLESLLNKLNGRQYDRINLYFATPALTKQKLGIWGTEPKSFIKNLLDEIIKESLHNSNSAISPIKIDNISLPSMKCVEKTSITMHIVGMGFDSLKKRPRPMMGAIMPGSVVQLKLSKPLNNNELKQIFWHGLGLHSDAGWGTFILWTSTSELTQKDEVP